MKQVITSYTQMEQTKVYVIICKKRTASVAKCRGSWVVGRCRGSWVWVWVNVVGEKMSSKKNKKMKKQKVVKFMKRKSPSTYQSYSPSPRSAKEMSESSSTNGH